MPDDQLLARAQDRNESIVKRINAQRTWVTYETIAYPEPLQLFTYGGLGRDLCRVPFAFSRLGLNKLFTGSTLLIAAINVILWVQFCRGYFGGWWIGGDHVSLFATADRQDSSRVL